MMSLVITRGMAAVPCAAIMLAGILGGGRPASAVEAYFTGLGDLPGGGAESLGLGISGDGSMAVGASPSQSSGQYREAFLWTRQSGIVGLGDFSGGGTESIAHDISADGSVIAGRGSPGSRYQEACIWAQDRRITGLGSLYGGTTQSEALGVSADGSVVVGWSSDQNGNPVAFRWTLQNGMVAIGGSYTTAWDASGDGSVVVGYGRGPKGSSEAFRWTEAGGMRYLGMLSSGHRHSYAQGVSNDGSVVVGYSGDPFYTVSEPFRWTEAGGMVSLGYLQAGRDTFAFGVSGDGSTIVGSSNYERAFIWDQARGMRDLQNLLVNELHLNLAGWSLRVAESVSADGMTIVGYGTNPGGHTEAWIARIPEPASLLLLALGGLAVVRRRRGGSSDTQNGSMCRRDRSVDRAGQPRGVLFPPSGRRLRRRNPWMLLSAILALAGLMVAPNRSQAMDVTLSDAGLLALDYDYYHFFIPHHTAHILARRDVPGPGVEFDIQFLNNYSPHNSLYWISDLDYGAGSITGIDVSAYSNFDLKFTILAADGVSIPGTGGSLAVGALIGRTASGTQYSYQPRGLSLGLSYPVTAVSSTQIGSPTITRIGFIVRLEPDWTAGSHTIALLIEPAPGAAQIPEPATLMLLALGGLAMMRRRRS